VLTGIANAMRDIYLDMMRGLPPVIGVDIRQPPRIKTAERIMAEAQIAAVCRAERELDVIVESTIQEIAALRPALVIDRRIDRIAWRAGGKHIA